MIAEANEVSRAVRARYWPALADTVGSLARTEPQTALILGYHLGLNDAAGGPEAGDDGLASTLCLAGLGARAAHADERQSTACALAVELTKDAIQLQDDILDDDQVRRGRPSAWRTFGIPATLLTIDLAKAVALDLLTTVGGHPLRATRHLQRYIDLVARGQAADLAAEQRPWTGTDQVGFAEYDRTIQDKGAGLVIAACTLGAVLTGADADVLGTLTEAGTALGMAWQILDDITDIYSAEGIRPYSSDLARGKKSYPVIAALTSGTGDPQRLADLLATRPSSAEATQRAAELIDTYGGRRIAQQRLTELYDRGLAALDHPALDRSAAAEMTALASLIGTRGSETHLTLANPDGHPTNSMSS